jgi:hypothetical protein
MSYLWFHEVLWSFDVKPPLHWACFPLFDGLLTTMYPCHWLITRQINMESSYLSGSYLWSASFTLLAHSASFASCTSWSTPRHHHHHPHPHHHPPLSLLLSNGQIVKLLHRYIVIQAHTQNKSITHSMGRSYVCYISLFHMLAYVSRLHNTDPVLEMWMTVARWLLWPFGSSGRAILFAVIPDCFKLD